MSKGKKAKKTRKPRNGNWAPSPAFDYLREQFPVWKSTKSYRRGDFYEKIFSHFSKHWPVEKPSDVELEDEAKMAEYRAAVELQETRIRQWFGNQGRHRKAGDDEDDADELCGRFLNLLAKAGPVQPHQEFSVLYQDTIKDEIDLKWRDHVAERKAAGLEPRASVNFRMEVTKELYEESSELVKAAVADSLKKKMEARQGIYPSGPICPKLLKKYRNNIKALEDTLIRHLTVLLELTGCIGVFMVAGMDPPLPDELLELKTIILSSGSHLNNNVTFKAFCEENGFSLQTLFQRFAGICFPAASHSKWVLPEGSLDDKEEDADNEGEDAESRSRSETPIQSDTRSGSPQPSKETPQPAKSSNVKSTAAKPKPPKPRQKTKGGNSASVSSEGTNSTGASPSSGTPKAASITPLGQGEATSAPVQPPPQSSSPPSSAQPSSVPPPPSSAQPSSAPPPASIPNIQITPPGVSSDAQANRSVNANANVEANPQPVPQPVPPT
ncbi:hypothetical protein SISNIDRAFT_492000 [Sistotremastrum niveocremeum HHB9708]|uniref:Uncharacterized protein n=1 Tax=Sistotremastrum niveocremeum HHB9708 TaxID=1314777 RepID=A0A164M5N0_9AGAM|nr:hypothetical protein SISNIDRAFT_492000 [Sistotremastrum niveocremeum HHB9708]